MKQVNYQLTSTELKTAKALYALYATKTAPQALTDKKAIEQFCIKQNAAFAVAYIASRAAVDNAIASGASVAEYLRVYAAHKLFMRLVYSDLGAVNDLYEVLIRIAVKRNLYLVRYNDLHVKSASRADIVIHGIPYEIGINGKTFTQATCADCMSGKFSGVIYGMANDDDRDYILNALARGDLKAAVNTLATLCGIWYDKYQFEYDMNNLSRGAGIVYKPHIAAAQVIYNDSKYRKFQTALENNSIVCLADYYGLK